VNFYRLRQTLLCGLLLFSAPDVAAVVARVPVPSTLAVFKTSMFVDFVCCRSHNEEFVNKKLCRCHVVIIRFQSWRILCLSFIISADLDLIF